MLPQHGGMRSRNTVNPASINIEHRKLPVRINGHETDSLYVSPNSPIGLVRRSAIEAERTIDNGLDASSVIPRKVSSFGDVIDLHLQDMLEVRKFIRRSKRAVL